GLGILAAFALTRPEKGERAADKQRPVAKMNTADIASIDVTKDGATTTIASEGGKYKVTAPVPYAADESIAKAAFEGLGKMDVSDLVTEQKAKQAEFQVDDKSGLHVVAKGKDGKALASVQSPKPAGHSPTHAPLWQTPGLPASCPHVTPQPPQFLVSDQRLV